MYFLIVIIINLITLFNCLSNNRGYIYIFSSIITLIFIGLLLTTNKFDLLIFNFFENNINFIIIAVLIFNGIAIFYDILVLAKYILANSKIRILLTLTSTIFYTPIISFIFIYKYYNNIRR